MDNLGANVDLKILKHLQDPQAEWAHRQTDKVRGPLRQSSCVDGCCRRRRTCKVHRHRLPRADAHVGNRAGAGRAKSIRKFANINTNSVYIDLCTMEHRLDEGSLELDIIVAYDGKSVIQLETRRSSISCNAVTSPCLLSRALSKSSTAHRTHGDWLSRR